MEFEDITNLLRINFPYFELGSNRGIVTQILGQPEGVFIQKKHNISIYKYGNVQLTFLNNLLIKYNFDVTLVTPPHLFKDIYNHISSIENIVKEDTLLHIKIILQNGFTFVFDKESGVLENIFFASDK